MFFDSNIWMGGSEKHLNLLLNKANRHGLITGASGTGKTITLKVMAEGFSAAGVPVFLADIKGDLAGMCAPGKDSEDMQGRIQSFGIDNWEYTAFPTCFWDVFGEKGLFLRATVSDMGPMLLSKLMNLTEVQEEVLNCVFKIADDNGLLLVDTKDLKAMLKYVGEHKDEFTADYGNLTPQSLSSIQRNVVSLETLGAETFFTEPMLDINDLFRTDENGRGYINVLDSVKLGQNKTLYSTFMLWLMSELYENLPEVGDLDKPKAVFFFDEAHLLFNDAPKVLIEKIEQVVRLIRSKGVGIYFISQSPADVPDTILAQLGNKVQHALRAYTPKEQKAVKAAAAAFRPNPAFDTESAITELSTGEALISFLDETGAPSVVERAKILPPQSQMGTIDGFLRTTVTTQDALAKKYMESVDNYTAYEKLSEVEAEANAAKAAEAEAAAAAKLAEKEAAAAEKEAARLAKKKTGYVSSAASRVAGNTLAAAGRSAAKAAFGSSTKSVGGAVASSLLGTVGREAGKSLVRGLFGSLK